MDYFDKAASGLAELGELVEGDLSGLEVVEGEVGCCFILFCFCRTLSSLFSRFYHSDSFQDNLKCVLLTHLGSSDVFLEK